MIGSIAHTNIITSHIKLFSFLVCDVMGEIDMDGPKDEEGRILDPEFYPVHTHTYTYAYAYTYSYTRCFVYCYIVLLHRNTVALYTVMLCCVMFCNSIS